MSSVSILKKSLVKQWSGRHLGAVFLGFHKGSFLTIAINASKHTQPIRLECGNVFCVNCFVRPQFSFWTNTFRPGPKRMRVVSQKQDKNGSFYLRGLVVKALRGHRVRERQMTKHGRIDRSRMGSFWKFHVVIDHSGRSASLTFRNGWTCGHGNESDF